MDERRMAILGGGPIGLECLLEAVIRGWDPVLFERGRVGESVRAWGHVRMFSPLAMNRSEAARAIALESDAERSDPEALLTGDEYVAQFLEPLAASPALAGRVKNGTEVVAVSRGELRKVDEIATPARGLRPFWILVRDASGERVESADVVVDATGTFGQPNWLGPGGMPAIGETLPTARVEYRLPDIPGRDRERFAGRHTVVIGAGHSAATAIGWLGDLAAGRPGTAVTWVTRSDRERPVPEIEDDPLAEREWVTRLANDAAQRAPGWLSRETDASVHAVLAKGGRRRIRVGDRTGERDVMADEVLALVGYRPDLGLARELQVRTCWATEGTYPLAAALLSKKGEQADCLAAGADLDASTLRHPEGDFYTLGMKSYGRNSNFLIRSGLKQIDDLFGLLGSS